MQENQREPVEAGRPVVPGILLVLLIAFAAGFVLGRIVGPYHPPLDLVEAGKP